jgi:GNAT superfamily N-acetyltransferase
MMKAATLDLEITDDPLPGSLARIVGMQAEWYAQNWGFGRPFEAKVAAEVGDYAMAQPHPDCRTWVARDAIGIAGSITIDGRANPVARLRWFFVEERARGGLGGRMLDRALGFCRDRGFREVWLTTFEGLFAARALYERAGFRLEHQAYDRTWGVEVREQVFRIRL